MQATSRSGELQLLPSSSQLQDSMPKPDLASWEITIAAAQNVYIDRLVHASASAFTPAACKADIMLHGSP
jgi:hypothetical protein